jgi:DNA-binding Xre family transcriptional regulator
MLTLNLTPIFAARGITKPYSFLVKNGFSPHSANSIINSKTRIFRLDHVEQLCTILVCEPNDILLWTPNKGQNYASDFPLNKLKQSTTADNFHQTLSTVPFKQLKEITSSLLSNNNLKKGE